MTILGFTGTRLGTEDAQHKALCQWVKDHAAEIAEFRHGCCLGADAEAWEVVTSFARGAVVHAHPSNFLSMTSESALHLANVRHEPKPPLDRNKDIVAACDVLLACPDGPERLRSGTWSTVRAARKAGKHIVICWPDGSVTEEPGKPGE